MRRRFTEETVLFVSVIKWVILATAVGAVTGLASTFFLKTLDAAEVLKDAAPTYYYAFLIIALPLVAWLGHGLLPAADAHTTDKVIETIHTSRSISIASVVKAFVLPVLTVGAGGSAGKEAPCADVGGGIGSLFGNILRLNVVDRRKLMICGVSAGFASVFGVPIGGSIFGLEVLFVGSMMYDVLLPSFISGITAFELSQALGITYFRHPIAFAPVFSEGFFLKVIGAGIFFGLCSAAFIEVLRLGQKFAGSYGRTFLKRAAMAGAALAVIGFLFSPTYLGLGLNTIESSVQGGDSAWYAPVVKIVTTSLTLSFGGSGGIVTPIFFVGSTAGSLFAHMFNLDPATFSAIGLVSLLAGMANTPIAASIMAVELFGPEIAPYATIACVISFLMTGHRSVYPSQILSIRKSESLQAEVGRELDEVRTTYEKRSGGLISAVMNGLEKIERLIKW
jgi:H+/Cl- antiporter ClcA